MRASKHLKRLRKWVKRANIMSLLPARRFHTLGRDIYVYAEPGAHVFFGYYDIDPISPDGALLLACRSRGIGQPLEVGYYHLDDPSKPYTVVGKTSAWNWQQGCRARWAKANSCDAIFYNALVDGEQCTLAYIVSTEQTITISPLALYAVDAEARYGLALDFARLHRFRPGYGYSSAAEVRRSDDWAPSDDGVWMVDLSAQSKELIVSFQDLAEMNGHTSNNSFRYVNHLDFVPDSDRIQLFDIVSTNADKGVVNFMTMERDGSAPRSLAKDIRPSHYRWIDRNHVMVTGLSARRRCEFNIYNEESGELVHSLSSVFTEDGHPSFVRGIGWISDTYPDKRMQQHLFYADIVRGRKVKLASFFSPAEFSGEARCDLHPRFSARTSSIVVDCIENGSRAMVRIPFDPANYI